MVAERELNFLEAHHAELMAKYEGEWIMLVGEKVVWHGENLGDGWIIAKECVDELGVTPFCHKMVKPESLPFLVNQQKLLDWIDERVKVAVQARDDAITKANGLNVAYHQGIASGLSEVRKQIEKGE